MKRLAFLLLLSLPLLTVAQTYTVRGTVVDSARHERLFYVRVGLVTPDSNMNAVAMTFTDAEGNFTLTDVPAGRYNLMAFLVSYAPVTKPVVCEGDNSIIDVGRIRLRKQSNALQEVTIAGEKPVYLVDGEKTMYNVAEDPTIQDGTAADALENAPGVEVDIEGNITLRGVSSVEIWLNDRPSHLTEENLKEFIQQLPANSLERIEVITNPSAKYSSKSDAGIINIVTTSAIKKNSFVSFGIRGSSSPNVTPWVSYVWANQKLSLNFYLNASYSFKRNNSSMAYTQFNNEHDTATTFYGSGKGRSHNINTGFNFNGSYVFDTLNTMRFWAGTYPRYSISNSLSQSLRQEYFPYELFQYNTSEISESLSAGAYGGLAFEHIFNRQTGHKIDADWTFNYRHNHGSSDYFRDYMQQNELDKRRLGSPKGNNFSTSASLDYVIPYHKNGEISVGVSGDIEIDKSLTLYDTLVPETDIYNTDSLRLKDVDDREYDLDAYVTIQHKFGNFTVKGGLRSEYVFYDYHILNAPYGDVAKGYFNLYPSLHLSYRTKSMHNFSLSYTRRVSNPSASRLSTYISYGEDDFSMGNPYLRPTYTNSVEAGWTKFFKKFGNVGINAYFRNSKDLTSNMTDVIFNDYFGRIVSFSQPVNAGKSFNTGADLNVTYRLKAFMNIRFYANLYYTRSEFQFRNETDPRITSNLGYSFRLRFWAKLWKKLEVNVSANYRSKNVSLFTTTLPHYSINAGLRADFFDRKLSVHLNVNDIFNWNRRRTTNENPYYVSTSTYKNVSRFITAGITFRFGKMELEKKATEDSGVESTD